MTEPPMSADELLTNIDPFELGKDQVEAAQIANANNQRRQPTQWTPAQDGNTPHRFGPLAAIAEKFGRKAG